MENQFRMYSAEFVGTFTLVFMGTAVAALQGFLPGYGNTGWLGISFAFGGTLAVLVLVIGPVSGCHVNPAVTIPMWLSGRLPAKLAPGYIASQILGAVAASLVLLILLGGFSDYESSRNGLGQNGNPHGMAVFALVGFELVMTMLFLFVIFIATRDTSKPGAHSTIPGVAPGFAALAIGGYLFLAHLVGAPLGDASLNPARSLGPALLLGGEALSIVWVFIAGPIAGGILGWLLYRAVYQE